MGCGSSKQTASSAPALLHQLDNSAKTPEIRQRVDQCWRQIDDQTAYGGNAIRQNRPIGVAGGDHRRIVRVFVSSTFVDFQSERDILVKRVFPQLRDWCRHYGLGLVDVDLRWGVPAETASTDTVAICMREIDRCIQETDGRPFFLGMLGDRYGWVPDMRRDLAPELIADYRWVDGVSITHMEFLHGAYRDRNPHALFLLRNDDAVAQLPDDVLARFCDREPLARAHLLTLKEKLHQRLGREQVFDYHCKLHTVHQDPATGRRQPVFTGLEESFAPRVLEFFKRAIQTQYNLQRPEDPQMLDDFEQRMYLEEVTERFVGREAMLDMLQRIADGHEDYQERIVGITSSSGEGKTALLAEFVKRQSRSRTPVFFHFTNAGADGADCQAMLGRLRNFCLKQNLLDPRQLYDKTDPRQQPETAEVQQQLWQQLSWSNRRLVLVIDAIDQLDNGETYQHLEWMPGREPPRNVTLIVGYDETHAPTRARLDDRRADTVRLGPLPLNEQKLLVGNELSRYGKRFDDRQLERLLRDGRSPVWLQFAIEELRLYGDFRSLDRTIDSLPDSTGDLIGRVLRRLQTQDDKTIRSADSLRLLSCAKFGLSEAELELLLGSAEVWSRSKVFVRPFVQLPYSGRRQVTCGRPLVKEVVSRVLLPGHNEQQLCHTLLAEFYLRHSDQIEAHRLIVLVAHHLLNANRKPELVRFLMEDKRATVASPHQRREHLLKVKCPNAVQHSMNGPGHDTAIVCKPCAAIWRLNGHQSQCFICQMWAQPGKPATLCYQHRPINDTCLRCGKMQPSSQSSHQLTMPLVVCTFCSTGLETCCHLPLEPDRLGQKPLLPTPNATKHDVGV